MGASNPHPHNQIWATSQVPVEPAKEFRAQADYLKDHGACLLCDYLEAERQNGERIVVSNASFTALVPFWATWPFELIVIAHRHTASLPDLDAEEVAGLADLLQGVNGVGQRMPVFRKTGSRWVGIHGSKGSTHVPIVFRSASVRKGHEVPSPATLHDILPTLCGILGWEIPETAAGKSRNEIFA